MGTWEKSGILTDEHAYMRYKFSMCDGKSTKHGGEVIFRSAIFIFSAREERETRPVDRTQVSILILCLSLAWPKLNCNWK